MSDKPEVVGWYGIFYSWDVQEGIHTGADYWCGDSWLNELPVMLFNGPHPSKEDAIAWAEQNDPDFQ